MNNRIQTKKKIENLNETAFIYFFFKKFQNIYEINFELEKLENALCDNENKFLKKIISSILRKGLSKKKINNWTEELRTLIDKRIKENAFYTNTNPLQNGNFYNLSPVERIKTLANICQWVYSLEHNKKLTLKKLIKEYRIYIDKKGNEYYKAGTYTIYKLSNNRIKKITRNKDDIDKLIKNLKQEKEYQLTKKLENEYIFKRKRMETDNYNKRRKPNSEPETEILTLRKEKQKEKEKNNFENGILSISLTKGKQREEEENDFENKESNLSLRKGKQKKEKENDFDIKQVSNSPKDLTFAVKGFSINNIYNKNEEETIIMINNIKKSDYNKNSFDLDDECCRDFILCLKELFS